MDKLGRYTLLKKLATGGMAEVFLAEMRGPGDFTKQVVVKRMLPYLAEKKSFREMFLAEAKVAASLNHPHIAQVFDFGQDGAHFFLAMELVDGPTLRRLHKNFRLLDRPLAPGACARLIAQACEGLAWAHQQAHLVHRDISTDNLLLGANGVLKVIDFGIARVETASPTTRTGTIKGKFSYMAPEQLRQEPVDARADIFSLGVCLYELLSGAVPTQGTSEVEAIQATLSQAPLPPLRDRAPSVPEPLAAIVTRALEKKRDDRYPDCRAFQAALEAFVESQGESWSHPDLAGLVQKFRSFETIKPAAGGDPEAHTELGTQAGFSDTRVRSDATPPGTSGGVLHTPAPATRRKRRVIPAALTRLWGRAADLASIGERFGAGARLVTLLGPGGTGKTRLAVAACEALLDRLEDGVVFVELQPLTAAAQVMPAISAALGLSEERGRSVEETIAHELEHKQLLLALDNFEHLLDAAPAVAALLRQAPGLLVLATSRVPLALQGESTLPLEPLKTPALDRPLSEAELLESPAAALFLERAKNHRPRLALSGDDATAIATLCDRLDGVPLALELAAARLKLLSPRELAARLTGAGVLKELKSVREASVRHRSLREVIDFSVGLLDAAARRHLAWLAVIPGPFSLPDAVALGAGQGLDEDAALAALEALTGAGLSKTWVESDGQTRFELFVTVRELALELLGASGELSAAQKTHAERILAVAAEADPGLTGPEQGAWRTRLERDQHQLRAAFDWLTGREPVKALQLAAGVWRGWFLAAHYSEAIERLGGALERAGGSASPELTDAAVGALARLLWQVGRFDESVATYELGLSQARARADRKLTRHYLYLLGYSRGALGRHDEAQRLLEEGRQLAVEDRDDVSRAAILGAWGESVRSQGRPADAAPAFAEQLAINLRLGDDRGQALGHYGLVLCAVQQGDAVQALKHARPLLEIALEIADVGYLPTDLGAAARAYLLEHSPEGDEKAGRLWAAVMALRPEAVANLDPLDQREVDAASRDVGARLGDRLNQLAAETRRQSWRQVIERVLQPRQE